MQTSTSHRALAALAAAGLAGAFGLPASAETLTIGDKAHVFTAPAGLCFLDPVAREADTAGLDGLKPQNDRYVVAAGFAPCDALDAWRADPRLRVSHWGAVFIDRRYVDDGRLNGLSAAAAGQTLRGLEGLGGSAGVLPAMRSAFAAFDSVADVQAAGWSSVRSGVRLGSVAAMVSADGESKPYAVVHGSTIFGGAVLEIAIAAPAADAVAVDALSGEVVKLAGALRGGVATAAAGDGGRLTRWLAPPEPKRPAAGSGGKTLAAAEKRPSVLVPPEVRTAGILADGSGAPRSALVAPERLDRPAFTDPAAPVAPPLAAPATPSLAAPAPVLAPEKAPEQGVVKAAPPAASVPPVEAPTAASLADPAGPPMVTATDFADMTLRAVPGAPVAAAAPALIPDEAPEPAAAPAFGEAGQVVDFSAFDLRTGSGESN
ncbi:MAG: hypothetical protein R3D02_12565 [Hyphomicrobiales bacterium]